MAFYLRSGAAKVEYYPKTSQTALTANSVVSLSSGYLIAATSSTIANIGVILRGVVATDSDYTGTQMMPVMVPGPDAIFIALATSASVAQVGTVVDLTDAVTVGTATSHRACYVVGYIDSTHLLVKLQSPQNATAT